MPWRLGLREKYIKRVEKKALKENYGEKWKAKKKNFF